MKKKTKTKKRNPQDATLRNIRAANAKLKRHHQWLAALTEDLACLYRRVEAIERQND